MVIKNETLPIYCNVSKNYTVLCYADDIMLTSLTSTGLQSLKGR